MCPSGHEQHNVCVGVGAHNHAHEPLYTHTNYCTLKLFAKVGTTTPSAKYERQLPWALNLHTCHALCVGLTPSRVLNMKKVTAWMG